MAIALLNPDAAYFPPPPIGVILCDGLQDESIRNFFLLVAMCDYYVSNPKGGFRRPSLADAIDGVRRITPFFGSPEAMPNPEQVAAEHRIEDRQHRAKYGPSSSAKPSEPIEGVASPEPYQSLNLRQSVGRD